MNLKKYLILTHLFVMIMPLVIILGLLKINENYNRKTEIKDYLTARVKINKMAKKLDNPDYYTGALKISSLNEEKDECVTLYTKEGVIIYCTLQENNVMLSKDELYKELNEVKHGYKADSLKQVVFKDGEIIGFYKIVVSRQNFIAKLQKNFYIAVTAFIIMTCCLFIMIMYLVDKKFTKRLNQVINGMNEYALGNKEIYIDETAKDEMGELAKHFNDMKIKLEEEKSLKEYMIASISHDLKTPLTTIRAYAETLELEDEHFDKKSEYLGIILNKCDYMREMLDDLMTYSVLTTNYKMNFVTVDGQELCEMLFSCIEELCTQKEIKLEQEIEVEGEYEIDVKYMTRVIDNIVSNAIRYTPVKGRLWMGAFSSSARFPEWINENDEREIRREAEDGMAIIVQNEGVPIKKEDCTKIFKPFYQADEARTKTGHKGVGLGLSIASMIIKKHQGKIAIYPVAGIGNRMICYIKQKEKQE